MLLFLEWRWLDVLRKSESDYENVAVPWLIWYRMLRLIL